MASDPRRREKKAKEDDVTQEIRTIPHRRPFLIRTLGLLVPTSSRSRTCGPPATLSEQASRVLAAPVLGVAATCLGGLSAPADPPSTFRKHLIQGKVHGIGGRMLQLQPPPPPGRPHNKALALSFTPHTCPPPARPPVTHSCLANSFLSASVAFFYPLPSSSSSYSSYFSSSSSPLLPSILVFFFFLIFTQHIFSTRRSINPPSHCLNGLCFASSSRRFQII
ncbi:hypothetical protein CP532_0760 [Ophiocordyceps camponoti-leonardi (nom. inval.)]|nr:hypothetical protein CP532_0760 [Ophiocordyceps camponoti-leonardi (nom. inval.)]